MKKTLGITLLATLDRCPRQRRSLRRTDRRRRRCGHWQFGRRPQRGHRRRRHRCRDGRGHRQRTPSPPRTARRILRAATRLLHLAANLLHGATGLLSAAASVLRATTSPCRGPTHRLYQRWPLRSKTPSPSRTRPRQTPLVINSGTRPGESAPFRRCNAQAGLFRGKQLSISHTATRCGFFLPIKPIVTTMNTSAKRNTNR